MSNMLFIPGPVMVSEDVRLETARSLISHRSGLFHELFEGVLDKLSRVLSIHRNRVVIFTSSGTGAVEALSLIHI